jgi:hypothetical protein
VNKSIPNTDGPDMIFPECSPSLAAILLDFKSEDRTMAEITFQLGEVQNKFKNSLVIILNCDDYTLNDLQLNLCGGSIRLLRCSSDPEAAKSLMEIYSALKDSKKLGMQKTYFELEGKKNEGKEKATHIAMASFEKLCIPINDGQLILDGFPSLRSIIGANSDILAMNSPADQISINKISSFFGASTILNENKSIEEDV